MREKIKVCFVSTSSYALFNENSNVTFGGAEVQVFNVSRELAKNKNFEVYVVVGDYGQNDVEEYNNVKVVKSFSLKKKIWNYLKGPFYLYGTLKKLNCDVIIQRAAAAETGICAFYCKINKKKFIFSVSCDNDVNGVFAKRNNIVGKLINYGINNANSVIVQSDNQIELLEKWKLSFKKNIELIKSSYSIHNSNNSNSKKYIFWQGRSDKLKRPDLLLELAKKFPKEQFLMLMPKSSDILTWEKYSNLIKDYKNVKFIEKVPFSKVQKYFDEAKIFVNTSDYEGFPNTFIQACLGKTPILSLNVNPDNFIVNNKLGFFANGSFDKLVKDLDFLLRNKKSYKCLSLNSYYYVQENHDVKKNIKKWENLLKKLIEL